MTKIVRNNNQGHYGAPKVTKLRPSTGPYGKQYGDKPNNAVKIRGGR